MEDLTKEMAERLRRTLLERDTAAAGEARRRLARGLDWERRGWLRFVGGSKEILMEFIPDLPEPR